MVVNLLKKIGEQARDFYHEEELKAFFSWLENQEIKETELIYIDLPLQKEIVSYSSIKNKKIRPKKPTSEKFSFIITGTGRKKDCLEYINFKGSEEDWSPIYRSARLEIWELKTRHTLLPLRFGLNESEKKYALQIVRNYIKNFLMKTGDLEKTSIKDFPRFELNASIDIALWCQGEIRGSVIEENIPFYQALKIGAERVVRDLRFKPVILEELPEAKIEISILSDLKIPLLKTDIDHYGFSDATAGFFVEEKERKGWYLPAVLNVRRFKNLPDLLNSLREEKARIHNPNIRAWVSMVSGFIENKNNVPLDLWGPVIKKSGGHILDRKNIETELKTACDITCNWVLKMQEKDGYMPLWYDPLNLKHGKADWPRMSATIYGLAHYAKNTKSEKLLQASKKSFSYILNFYEEMDGRKDNFTFRTYHGSLAYLAQTAIVLNDLISLQKINALIEKNAKNVGYSPILYANLASLFADSEVIKNRQDVLENAIVFADHAFEDYRKRVDQKKEFELAQYPELINSYIQIYKVTKNPAYLEKSDEIANWFINQQLPDGSFPSRVGSIFAYTRGTGKIFEVLALRPKKNIDAIILVLNWLLSMQYDSENTYFIKPNLRENILGGFRHDFTNPEAWVDAAGHFLLGASRMLHSELID